MADERTELEELRRLDALEAKAAAAKKRPRTIVDSVGDFAAGANRSILGGLDFFGPGAINSVLEIAGSDKRVPTFLGSAEKIGVGQQTNSIAGQVGAALPAAMLGGAAMRAGAQSLSPFAAQSENALRGILRQAGATTPAADLGYGLASGIGGGIGEKVGGETGKLVGFFAGPMVGGMAAGGLKALVSTADDALNLSRSLSGMSEKGAATLLADAMVREGVSPDDVAKQLAALGPDAIPADVNNSFARLLRAAANEIPRIQGRATSVLNQRQAGQAGRLASSIDDSLGVPGLSVDDEIARMREAFAPVINDLYESARGTPVSLSDNLKKLLTGNNSLGDAFKSAQRRVADKRAAGDIITNFDLIDATKQQLDDQIGVAIRSGEKNRARDLVRLKNVLVEEADVSVPGYAEARRWFAGKMALESAAEQGGLFLKMNPREVEGVVSGMKESELRMFRLGAKQAILDKVDTLPVGSDSWRRLFGKNGDTEKLKSLFPDEAAFNEFNKVLEREAIFSMTRRAAQGNSTTAMQLADSGSAVEAMNTARAIAGDPKAAAQEFGRIITGLASRKTTEANRKALESAGDILLNAGTDPAELQRLLRMGDTPRLRKLLETELIIKPSRSIRSMRTAITSDLGDQ